MADVEVQVASGERAEGLEVPSKPRRVSPREIELRQRLVQLLREQRGLKSRLTGIKRRLERAGAQTGEKERAGVKRDRDGLAPDEAEPRAKRARIDESALEVSAEHKDERKPLVQESEADKTRNKRLFGSLLFGTLKAIKKDTSAELQRETTQKRKELETEIEQKVVSDISKSAEVSIERLRSDLSEIEKRLAELPQEIKETFDELTTIRRERKERLLSGFLKTTVGPTIYFLPAKIDDFVIRELGLRITAVEEAKVEESVLDEEESAEAAPEAPEERQEAQEEAVIEDA